MSSENFPKNGYQILSHGGIGNRAENRNLTGSCHELRVITKGAVERYLIDFGGYQWPGKLEQNMEEILGSANDVEMAPQKIVITHGHMDHIGKLLEVTKRGAIEIICTPETKQVIEIALSDAIKIEEREHKIKQDSFKSFVKKVLKPAVDTVINADKGIKRSSNGNRMKTTDQEVHTKEYKEAAQKILEEEGIDAHDPNWRSHLTSPTKPRFSQEDLEKLLSMITTHSLTDGWNKISDNVEMTYFNAGHILGSASPLFRIKDHKGKFHHVQFTGDIGRYDGGVAPNGKLTVPSDFLIETLVTESTYGGRMHENFDKTLASYQQELSRDIWKYDRIVQACFALDRLQKMLYYTIDAKKKWRIANNIPILVDSKMGAKYIDLYLQSAKKELASLKNSKANAKHRQYLEWFIQALDPENEEYTVLTSEDRDMILSSLTGKSIVLTASGMADGGPIQDYIRRYADDQKTAFYFPGYLVEETLGHKLAMQQQKRVDIDPNDTDAKNHDVVIRAKMKQISGFSGHADEEDIFKYISQMKMNLDSKIAIIHGDVKGSSLALKHSLERKWVPQACIVPDLRDIYTKTY